MSAAAATSATIARFLGISKYAPEENSFRMQCVLHSHRLNHKTSITMSQQIYHFDNKI